MSDEEKDNLDEELESLLSSDSESECPLGLPRCKGSACKYWKDGRCTYDECKSC